MNLIKYETDIDECATGTHNCHKDAICTNTEASYTCKCRAGLKGNGIFCNEPGKFKDAPQTVRIKFNETVRLSCSYYHQVRVVFSWIKDSEVVNTGSYNVAKKTVKETGLNEGSNLTTQFLEFNISKGEEQGYYWCKIDDIRSTQGTVFLKDASTTKLSLKVSQGYTAALDQRTSPEYIKLQTTIKSRVDRYIDSKNTARRRRRNIDPSVSVLILRNVRSDGSGKILLDAFIYYAPINDTRKVTVCNTMQNVTTADMFSLTTPSIELVQRITYDCCYGEWTGNKDIKGVIGWPTQAILSNSTVACPYKNANETATRQCVSHDFERQPTWKEPYDGNCLYVHESTRELSDLSQQTINASDVVKVVAKLENVTKKQENIRSYVDVSLAVDVITKVAAADKTNKAAFKGILQVTDSLMSAKGEVVRDAQQKTNSSEKLVNAVEAFAENIPVPENETVIFKEKNLAVGVAVVEEKQVQEGYFIKGSVDVNETSLEMKEGAGSRDSTQVANIFLPGPLFTKAKNQIGGNASATRVTTFLYDNEKLFISKETSGANAKKKLNSRILAVSIKGIKLENLTDEQRIKSEFKALNKTGSKTVRCVYWEETIREWSQRGCRLDGTEGNISKCSCNHLTNFAILLDVEQKPSPTQPPVIIRALLQYFTYIGCALSLAALLITLITFAVFKNLRQKDPQKILMCICTSLILALVAFLVGTQYSERFTENTSKIMQNSPIVCLVSSVTTHYFVLCSFFWMAMHSYYLYLSCVKVMSIHSKNILKKMAVTAFGIPLLAVAIVVGVGFTDMKDYANQSDANVTTPVYSTTNHYVSLLDNKKQQICMINGIPFYAAYLAPIGIILIINFVLMTLAFRGIYASSEKTKSKKMSLKRKIRMVFACVSIMGLAWVFGVFAIGDAKIPFQIAFTVLNSLQGVLIFIFYCLLSPKVQYEWRKCLCGDARELTSSSQRSQKINTSSSFMSTRLRKLSGAFIRESSRHESKKESEASSHEESLSKEERARRYTNSLSALHQEFRGMSLQNDSVFVQFRGGGDSYSFVGPGVKSEEVEMESFKKIERDPKLATAL